MPNRTAIALLVLVLAAGAAAAEPVPPGGAPDVVSARTLGLSSTIGVAAANDAIYVNPAAIASRKRYSIEALGFADRRGAETVDRFYGASVVDSVTSPVSAGVSFLREQGDTYTGNLFDLVLAGPVSQGIYLGTTGKLYSLHGRTDYQAANVDAGLFWQLTELVSLGVVGYNLVPGGNAAVAPTMAGAGLAIGSDRIFQVTGDWRADFDRHGGKVSNRYAVGAEALIAKLVPVRAGFLKDDTLGTNWWSAGAGIVTPVGAVELGYRQSTSDPSARTLAASIKFFIPQ